MSLWRLRYPGNPLGPLRSISGKTNAGTALRSTTVYITRTPSHRKATFYPNVPNVPPSPNESPSRDHTRDHTTSTPSLGPKFDHITINPLSSRTTTTTSNHQTNTSLTRHHFTTTKNHHFTANRNQPPPPPPSSIPGKIASPNEQSTRDHTTAAAPRKLGGKISELAKMAAQKANDKKETKRQSRQSMTQALPYGDAGSHQEVSLPKLFSILTPEYNMMAIALGGITVSASATMAFPNAIGQMIDLLSMPSTPTTLQEMSKISVNMIGIFSAGACATFLHSAVLQTVGQKVGARLRKRLFDRIMSQQVAFFDQNRAGELANRLSTDVHEVAEHLVENVASFLESGVKSLSAIAAMLFISPLLTLYSSAVVPAVILGATFYGKFIKRLSRKHLDALATSTHIAAERFGGIATVLSFGQKSAEVQRYSGVIERAYTLARKVAIFEGGFLGTSYFIGNAALLGVLWAGSRLVFDGSMTAGQLASFCMYAGHLAGSVSEITESISGFLRAQGSGARLFALLDKEPVVPSGTRRLPEGYEGVVKLENVNFTYPGYPDTQVLNNVTLELNEGELTAVTGRSGCGKSSMLALLQRMYEPDSGRITIDGVDIRELDIDWLRQQVGSVRQEPILFAASVAENIAYGKPEATLEEIKEACIQANVHDFILALPNGYDTVVGERGTSLSGGQKQRLCIARALLGKPRFLTFDEATSALDSTTERLVFNSLNQTMVCSRMTVIVVAHHLSTLAQSDRVLVLEEGKFLADGNFDSLTAEGGPLRQMVDAGTVHEPHAEKPDRMSADKRANLKRARAVAEE